MALWGPKPKTFSATGAETGRAGGPQPRRRCWPAQQRAEVLVRPAASQPVD